MDGWRKVLIPLDGSDLSEWAVSRASGLLRRPGVSVTLLFVAEAGEDRAGDVAFRVSPEHEEIRDRLARLRDRLVKRSVSAIAELRFGDPATEILREATAGSYDLIVMTTHGRTGLARVLFGSVALKVLRASPAPLLLFRPIMRPDETLSPVETSEAAAFRRILVPLDGSPAAEEILPAARSLAAMCGSKLHLLRAVPGGPQEEHHVASARKYLEVWQGRIGAGTDIDIRVGPAVEAALDAIREGGLDTVAMTTHGRTGLNRAMYGSVAERLLGDAGVPVLTFRNHAIREPLPRPEPGRFSKV